MPPPVPQQRVRYDRVRVADTTDDQKTAGQIVTGATGGSVTQEEYQEFVLSQMKRMIFGDLAGNWYDDFLAGNIPPLAQTERVEKVAFAYNTPSPLVLQQVFPGQLLNRCAILLTTPFNDPAASVTLGTTTSPSLVMAAGEATLTILGNTYDQSALFEFSIMDFFQLTISPGVATAGAGLLLYKMR